MEWFRNRSPWREVAAVVLVGGALVVLQLWAIRVTAPHYSVAPAEASR